jgi:hypothetical protein
MRIREAAFYVKEVLLKHVVSVERGILAGMVLAAQGGVFGMIDCQCR